MSAQAVPRMPRRRFDDHLEAALILPSYSLSTYFMARADRGRLPGPRNIGIPYRRFALVATEAMTALQVVDHLPHLWL
jgi:hypothetical protein